VVLFAAMDEPVFGKSPAGYSNIKNECGEKKLKHPTMEKEIIINRLTPLFRRVFSDQLLVVTEVLSAQDVENWDSLTHMLLISEVESEFAIKFKLKDLNKMANVGDMIAIIESKL